MKTHSDNIKSYFDEARKQETVLKRNEVKNILENAGSSPTSGSGKNAGTGNFTFLLFSASGLLLLIITGVILFNYEPETNPGPQTTIIEIPVAESQPKTEEVIVKNKVEEVESFPVINSKQYLPAGNLPVSDTKLFPFLPQSKTSLPYLTSSGEKIQAELGITGLEKLGIFTDGHSLTYKNVTDSFIIPSNNEKIFNYYLIEVEAHGNIRFNHIQTSKREDIKNSKTFWPVFVLSVLDSQLTQLDHTISNNYKETYFDAVNEYLVPVHVKLNPPPGKKGPFSQDRELVFWFTPTAELYHALGEYPASGLTNQPHAMEKILEVKKNINALVEENKKKTTLTSAQWYQIQNRTLVLSTKELKQLGFQVSDRNVIYSNTLIYADKPVSLKLRVSAELRYTETMMDNQGIEITKKSKNFYPVCVSDSTLRQTSIFYFDLISKYEDVNGQVILDREERKSTRFFNSIDSLIPIAIRSKNKSGIMKTALFWFPLTADFVNALPKHAVDQLSRENGWQSNPAKINLTEVNVLQITNEQLLKLGVKIDESKNINVPVPDLGSGFKQFSVGFGKEGTVIRINSIQRVAIEAGDSNKNTVAPSIQMNKYEIGEVNFNSAIAKEVFPAPVLITDDLGLKWRAHQVTDDTTGQREVLEMEKRGTNPYIDSAYNMRRMMRMLKRINTLVAVLVRSGAIYSEMDKIKGLARPDIILWYEPTEEFLKALPAQLAEDIRLEYSQLFLPAAAPKAASSCRYFEICRYSKGPLDEIIVYPNPVQNELNISGNLKEDRKLRIFVTDISGKILLNGEEEEKSKGKFNSKVNLDALPKGLYLLIIDTDKGERVTERIMKN